MENSTPDADRVIHIKIDTSKAQEHLDRIRQLIAEVGLEYDRALAAIKVASSH